MRLTGARESEPSAHNEGTKKTKTNEEDNNVFFFVR
jgi:hypothetical protein